MRAKLAAPALVLVLVLVLGCRGGEVPAPVGFVEPEAGAEAPSTVVETGPDRQHAWPCGDELVSDCVGNYLRFARRNGASPGREECLVETADRLARLSAAPPEGQFLDEPPLPAPELGTKVRQAIRLDSVLEARAGAPLRASVARQYEYEESTMTELFLTAAPVGRVPVLLARPKAAGQGPLPAVLALPGENTEALDFLVKTLPGLLERGYVVAAPSFRGFEGGELEHRVTLELWCGASSFGAIRHYETLLALEYLEHLRARGEVGRIALVGHSGGAGIANALMWYQGHRLAAVASDIQMSYISVNYDQDEAGQPLPGTISVLGESNEQLHQLAAPINNFGMAPVPVGLWPYGYKRGQEFLYRWLDEQLGVSSP